MAVNKIFDQVQVKKPKRSAFDLSHEKKFSCNMGSLVPVLLEEIIPGDQFKVNSEIMIRMAPMLAPVMHRVDVYMHYFYVPNRIIWDQWDEFITGGDDGTAAPVLPQVTFSDVQQLTRFAAGSLMDYLGLPTIQDPNTATQPLIISALPFRGYTEIWNEYYRDENLQVKADLTVTSQITELRDRAWEKDYFTSALPFAQKGAAVSVPLTNESITYKNPAEIYDSLNVQAPLGAVTTPGDNVLHTDTPDMELRIENIDTFQGEINIEELRRSSVLQRWLEKAARGGSRVKEMILSQFAVNVPDSRLQRPEYLGGGKQQIKISEVLNTTGVELTDPDSGAPQGDMAGHGIAYGANNSFQRSFAEHGYVFGIMSVLPRTAYQQGVKRSWTRTDKFDYAWPDFANLGEQTVEIRELYFNYLAATPEINTATFGYQQRFAEYKYSCDHVAGDFKTTLDYWHLGRIFIAAPQLNEGFIKAGQDANDLNRIFAVQDGTDTLWVQIYHKVHARRPLPYFADPRLT